MDVTEADGWEGATGMRRVRTPWRDAIDRGLNHLRIVRRLHDVHATERGVESVAGVRACISTQSERLLAASTAILAQADCADRPQVGHAACVDEAMLTGLHIRTRS